MGIEDILKNTDRTPIFCDLNNLLYRAFYVFTPDRFKTKQGIPNGHLFGLCQNIKTMNNLNYEIFLCEDSHSVFRKNINEDYKSNREPSENNTQFWKEYSKIHDLISNLPHANCIKSEGYEADDVMYTAAKMCSSLGKKCFIFTTDKDLLQALDENITIVHKVTMKENEEVRYKSDEYYDKFPVEPDKLPLYRAFKGDGSDNIEPLVKRLPKDLIIDLVDYLYDNHKLAGFECSKKSHEKWLKEVINNWDRFLSNYRIMRLKPIDIELVEKSNQNSYIQICNEYELNSFLSYNMHIIQ